MRWQSQPSSAKKNHATHSSTVCFCSGRCLPAHGEQLKFNCSRGQLRRTITSASLTQQTWAGVPTHTRLHWARGTVRLFCCRETVVFFGYYHVRALRDDIFFVLELLHCSHTYDGAVSTDCSRCLKLHAHVLSARRRLRAGAERVVKPTHYTSNLRTWNSELFTMNNLIQLVENLFFLLPPEDLEFGVWSFLIINIISFFCRSSNL